METTTNLDDDVPDLIGDVPQWAYDNPPNPRIEFIRRNLFAECMQRREAASKIQRWWRNHRRPLSCLNGTFEGYSLLYDMTNDTFWKLYWHRKRCRVLDRYIEHATRPDHPATRYLLARQIKEQNAL